MKPIVKLFRKVLSKSSTSVKGMIDSQSKDSLEESSISNSVEKKGMILEPSSSCSQTDVKALEDQLENLKAVITNLRNDIEKKEIGIANLAREKEKLSLDLLRQKRSHTNILKQLEDERKFYFKEKESYCNEMREMKELRKSWNKTNWSTNENSFDELRNNLENMKQKLKETLEANYNLSIKYLRIKNTKGFLRNELVKTKMEHEKIFSDLRAKIETMAAGIEEIVGNELHVSPSNKKYVQLVRQNSSLVHENLYLQMEVDRLNSYLKKTKLKYTKSETNQHLKYIHALNTEVHNGNKRDQKKLRVSTQNRDMMADERMDESNLKSAKCQSEIIKIFERNASDDMPTVQIENEDIMKKKAHRKHKRNRKRDISKMKLKETTGEPRDLKSDIQNTISCDASCISNLDH